ncbi:MAG TPA: type IV secretory system conjugative DNA transfer family protein, partial [Marmoricola sp.]|nr:type IV secretory system conjugative DNA transfer family protein [Marmoricola sp.]
GCSLEIEVLGRSRLGTLDLAHRIVRMLRSRVIRGHFTLRTNGRVERFAAVVAHRGPAPLSPGELAGVIGWPVGSPSLPNLELGTAPQLAADSSIPYEGEGRRVGTSTWPGKEDRQLVQPPEGALSHALVVGPTGSGKSTLMVEMAADDLREGRGLVLIDLKGDTAEDVLARVPEHRAGEVIVLDPAAGLAVPGLRVLGGTDPELAADQLLTTFKGIFTDSWGVRSDQYLRLGFVTLAHDPEATLADLGFLFSDASFRRRMTGNLEDPMLTAAWASYEAMKPAEQSQHLASPLRKVNEVIGRRVVRAVLAQTKPRFDMNQVLAKGQVVVVSLSPGRLGGPAATLIGALVIYEIYKAVLARQTVPQMAREPFGLYIDEPKLLTQGTPLPLDSMFELFRGLGVGITLAAQSIGQLGRDLQKAAVSNSGT